MLENSMKLRSQHPPQGHKTSSQSHLTKIHFSDPNQTPSLGLPAELWGQASTTQRRALNGPVRVHLSTGGRLLKDQVVYDFLIKGIVYCIYIYICICITVVVACLCQVLLCIYIYIQFQPLYGSMPRKHFTESFQPWSGMCCCQRWHFAKRSSNSHAWTNHKAGTVWKLGQQCGKYDPVQPQPKIFRLKLENMVPYWKDSRSDFWDYVPFSRVLRNNTSLLCAASTKALRFLQTNFHWRNIRPCFS